MSNSRSTSELINCLAEDLAPARPTAGFGKILLGWVAIAAIVVFAGLIGTHVRADLGARLTDLQFVVEALSLVLIGVSAGALALALSIPGSNWAGPRRLLVFACGLLLAAAGFSLASHWQNIAALGMGFRPLLYCSTAVIVYGVVPAIILVLALVRAAPLRAGPVFFLALLAAGSLGAFALKFSCINDNLLHLVLAHWLPALGLGLLGLALGHLVMPWEKSLSRLAKRIEQKQPYPESTTRE